MANSTSIFPGKHRFFEQTSYRSKFCNILCSGILEIWNNGIMGLKSEENLFYFKIEKHSDYCESGYPTFHHSIIPM
jgi:hypothetical protein